MGFNKTIEYKYGPVILAENYETREAHFEEIEKVFSKMFQELYQTE